MSLQTLCTGDVVKIVTVSGGGFGSTPTFTESDTEYSCRIDSYGGPEDRRGARADKLRSMTVFFLTEPPLRVGQFLKWTKTGSPNNTITFSTPIYMRAKPPYPEGRPGEAPAYWVVDAEEASVRDIGGQVS